MAKKGRELLSLEEKKDRFNVMLKEARTLSTEYKYEEAKRIYEKLMKELKFVKSKATNRIVTFEYYSIISGLLYLDTAKEGFTELLSELLLSDDGLEKENIKLRVKILYELGRIHLIKGEYKDAVIKMNMLHDQASKALDLYKDKENRDTLASYINYANVKRGYLYAKSGDFKKSFEFLSKSVVDGEGGPISSVERTMALYYLKKKLSIPTEKDFVYERQHPYFIKQITNYDEKEAKEHIKLHKQDSDIFVSKDQLFYEDTNMEQLFEEVKQKISKETFYKNSIVDKYIINFGRPIGTNDGVQTNLVVVVTLLNEPDKILTMYPALPQKSYTRVR